MDREVGQLYTVARAVLDPVFAFLWRIEVEGREHLPEGGGAILAFTARDRRLNSSTRRDAVATCLAKALSRSASRSTA